MLTLFRRSTCGFRVRSGPPRDRPRQVVPVPARQRPRRVPRQVRGRLRALWHLPPRVRPRDIGCRLTDRVHRRWCIKLFLPELTAEWVWPTLILRSLLRYDERFRGYGYDKISFVLQASLSHRFTVLTLPSAFLVDTPHEPSRDRLATFGPQRDPKCGCKTHGARTRTAVVAHDAACGVQAGAACHGPVPAVQTGAPAQTRPQHDPV